MFVPLPCKSKLVQKVAW